MDWILREGHSAELWPVITEKIAQFTDGLTVYPSVVVIIHEQRHISQTTQRDGWVKLYHSIFYILFIHGLQASIKEKAYPPCNQFILSWN